MRKKKYLCSLKIDIKMNSRLITRTFTVALVALITAMGGKISAQSVAAPPPCPDVKINEKYDHITNYRNQGWDTVVNCVNNGVRFNPKPPPISSPPAALLANIINLGEEPAATKKLSVLSLA